MYDYYNLGFHLKFQIIDTKQVKMELFVVYKVKSKKLEVRENLRHQNMYM